MATKRKRRHGKDYYIDALLKAIRDGRIPVPPGKVRVVGVFHDAWCAIYHGGHCDCEPTIVPRPAGQTRLSEETFAT